MKLVNYIVTSCPSTIYAKLTLVYVDENSNTVCKTIGTYMKLSVCLKKAHYDFEKRFKGRPGFKFNSVCKNYKSFGYYTADIGKSAFNENI